MKTDAELQQDVMNELKWEPTVKAAEIGVGVKGGVVTLSGYVDTTARSGLPSVPPRESSVSRRWRKNLKSGCLILFNARTRILPRRQQISYNGMSG